MTLHRLDLDTTHIVAHELRGPLLTFRGRLHEALEAPWCGPECRTLLEECLRDVESMEQLILDVLLLARAGAGGLPAEPIPFDLSQLSSEVVEENREGAVSRRVHLDVDVRGSLPVRADRKQMKRVLSNLLDNAIRYTPSGGRVRVEAWLSERAEIRVSDTGIGISAEHIPHVFEPFYQVDRDRSREAGGVGLGLAIARALAQANDALIEVESRPGQGSQFTLVMPVMGRGSEQKELGS